MLTIVLLAAAALLSLVHCSDSNNDGKKDAGKVDAGKTDAGKVDAGKTDVGKVDAGKTDAGKTDAGKTGDALSMKDGADSGGSSSSAAQYSCLSEDKDAGNRCTEYFGYTKEQIAAIKALCNKWTDGPCSKIDSSGGCKTTEVGGKAWHIEWYFSTTVALGTKEEVSQYCKENGLEYLAP
jgi:hypothetical protein